MAKIAVGVGLSVVGAVVRYWITNDITALGFFLFGLILIAWGVIDEVGNKRREEGVPSVTDGASGQRPLPDNRPKVVPDRYGISPQRLTSEGLHVVNHGEVALDVEAEPISLPGESTVRFDGIERLQGAGFMLATFHQNGTQITSSLDYLWGNAFEKDWQSKVVPLTLTYRDLDGRSYRTLCEIQRDVKNYPGFAVRIIRQVLS